MRASIDRLYPVLALALLAAGTVWLERVSRVDDPAAANTQRSGPDFIAEQTRILGFGSDGRQRYELVSERLTHYPQDDTTKLEQPRLTMQSEGRQLRLTSAEADVSPGGERVDMSGEVRGRRESGADRPEITFASEKLTVWPDDHRAATDTPVVLTQGQSTATARGLRADNLFGNLTLIGDAKVTMPRRPRNPS